MCCDRLLPQPTVMMVTRSSSKSPGNESQPLLPAAKRGRKPANPAIHAGPAKKTAEKCQWIPQD